MRDDAGNDVSSEASASDSGPLFGMKVERHGDLYIALRQHPHVALLLRILYQQSNQCSS
jgi:hypothetical protein